MAAATNANQAHVAAPADATDNSATSISISRPLLGSRNPSPPVMDRERREELLFQELAKTRDTPSKRRAEHVGGEQTSKLRRLMKLADGVKGSLKKNEAHADTLL